MCDYSERIHEIENGLRELGLKQCDTCSAWKIQLYKIKINDDLKEVCDYCYNYWNKK
jgi:hypothetical protein